MANTFSNLIINDLTEFSFIAGTKQVLTFDIYDASGSSVDLSPCVTSWVMSPYGNPQYATLTIGGTLSGSSIPNRFEVIISGSSTENLSGKYTHQPVVTDYASNEFRPSQGNIIIVPRNATI